LQTLEYELVSISITELKVQKILRDAGGRYDLKKNLGGVELAIKIDVRPTLPRGSTRQLQLAIFDANNQLIYTLVQGSRTYHQGETVYAMIPATVPADLTKVFVNAWITDQTIIRKYDIWTTTGAIEKNRISNVASKIIKLTGAIDKQGNIVFPQLPAVPPQVAVISPPVQQVISPPVQQVISPPTPEPTPAPVAESVPVGNLNPYQLTTTINPKWILLAIAGVGILSAMIFIMRRRN